MLVPNESKRRLVAEYGPYQIWLDPLVHMPWGLFRIWRDAHYIGAQISHPSLADCGWLESSRGRFSYQSAPEKPRALRGVAKNRSYSIHRRQRIEPEAALT